MKSKQLRERGRQQKRKYRERHPDYVERQKGCQRRYYQQHKEELKRKAKEYYQKHKQTINKRKKASSRAYYLKNLQHHKTVMKRWYEENREDYLRKRNERKRLFREFFIFNYVVRNLEEFGYVEVHYVPTKDFDVICIKEDGAVEYVELEVASGNFITHGHSADKCDRIIAVYNTEKNMGVPITLIDKQKYLEYVKELLRTISRDKNVRSRGRGMAD